MAEEVEEKILTFKSKYKKEADLYRKIIHVYNIIADLDLSDKQIEALIRYIRHGYSIDTKDLIEKELNFKSSNYIHVMNHYLKKKGCLVDDTKNRRKKHISKELQNIKDLVENGKMKKLLPVLFVQK